MTFDIVISNPPYDINNGGGKGKSSKSAIYHYFLFGGYEICNQYCMMIIPSRWMSNNANGIDKKYISRMRQSTHIKDLIIHNEKVFTEVNIAGETCIINLDKNHEYPSRDKLGYIIQDKEYAAIIDKVVNNQNIDFRSLSLYIDSDCFRSGEYMNSPWGGYKEQASEGCDIEYYYKYDRENSIGYVSNQDIIKNSHVVDEYKLLVQSSSPLDEQVIYKPFVIGPNSCCSRTFIVIHGLHNISPNTPNNSNTSSKIIYDNCKKYLETKFARACIKAIKTTQNASKGAYTFVPLQDFTSPTTLPPGHIDWSQPIIDIDNQLYQKYKLSQSEIDYIEKTISPIE